MFKRAPLRPTAPSGRTSAQAPIGKEPLDGEANDVLLLRRVAARDRGAFEALYRAYYFRLTRFLERMTHRPLDAEEVLNDTMVVVWDSAAKFAGRSKVSTWIFGIAYRKALKALRNLDEPVECDDGVEGECSESGPEGQVMQRQLREVLCQALNGLTAEQRAVVALTFFQGFAYAEIAQIVGCPVDTVKTRMFHARRHLRAALAGLREDLP